MQCFGGHKIITSVFNNNFGLRITQTKLNIDKINDYCQSHR